MRLVWLLGILLVACAGEPTDYLELAFSQNDSSHCANVEEQHLKNWCYTDIAANLQDASICDNLEGEFRNNCVKNIAVATQDAGLCSEISGLAGDRCHLDLAIELQDASLCHDIESELGNECYNDLARSLDDYQLCLNIEDDVQQYDSCLLRVSLDEQDMTGCRPIYTQRIKDVCYMNHAIQQLDVDLCEEAGQFTGACKQAVAIEIDSHLNTTNSTNSTQ